MVRATGHKLVWICKYWQDFSFLVAIWSKFKIDLYGHYVAQNVQKCVRILIQNLFLIKIGAAMCQKLDQKNVLPISYSASRPVSSFCFFIIGGAMCQNYVRKCSKKEKVRKISEFIFFRVAAMIYMICWKARIMKHLHSEKKPS